MKHLSVKSAKKNNLTGKLWFFICLLAVACIDQISKRAVVSMLVPYQSIPIIPGFFHITFIYNSGATFGMLQGRGTFFIIAACLMTLAICWFALFHRGLGTAPRIILGLITGGALGNLTDRLHYGAVVDFIDFRGIWPYIFNAADSAIVCGGFLLAICFLYEESKTKKTMPKH
ncbi:MAG: signal peptidase II [Peptococcaceae bacterium]|jgi:signal peptidase II|nr:signal peptidase II [Peptococcaceae bacterium]